MTLADDDVRHLAIVSTTHLQNQARPLHSNAHIFKIAAPICTVFGKIKRHNVVNISIRPTQQVVQTSSAKHFMNAELPLNIR